MATSTTPNCVKVEPSLPPLVVPIWRATPRARASAASEPHVLLGHRDRLPELHAERLGAGARRRTHADAEGRGRAARESRVAGDEDAGDVSTIGMDERGLGLIQRQDESTAVAQAQRAVRVDRVDTEADLVHVRDDYDGTVTLPGADPEVARGIGFRSGPSWEETLHRRSDRRFHARDTIALDELGKNALGLGDSACVLDRENCHQCEHHWEPPIHFTMSALSASTSFSPTVSTIVSGNFEGTVTNRLSVNGPC